MSGDFWLGVAAVPVVALIAFLSAALLVWAWDKWEALLRRLRPRRVPDKNQNFLASAVALARTVWRIWLPGALVLVIIEGSVGNREDHRAARRAITTALDGIRKL